MADGSFPENGEGLFPAAPPPEVHEGDLATPERAEHIIEALNSFDDAATHESLIRKFANQDWLRKQQGEHGRSKVYNWQYQVHVDFQQSLEDARSAFRLAYPPSELVNDDVDLAAAEAEIDRQYDNFQQTYRGSSQARFKKRQQVRDQYRRHLGEQQVEAEITEESAIVEAEIFPAEDPAAKVSLARALRPEFSHLDPAKYKNITDEMIKKWNPNFFRASLINVNSGTRNARGIPVDGLSGTRRRVFTVFAPGEWTTLLRSQPQYLGEVAFNKSEVTQHKLDPEERDLEAPIRAEIGSNRRQAVAMREHIERELDVSLDVIARFEEAARFNGGLARFGNEANMRVQLDYFWKNIVGEMVWATRIVRHWPPEVEEQVMDTLEKGVHFAPTSAMRLRNLGYLADAARDWILARKQHLQAKAFEADHYADEVEYKQLETNDHEPIPS